MFHDFVTVSTTGSCHGK